MSAFELFQSMQLRGALLITGTLVVVLMLRHGSAAVRHLVWTTGVMAALVVPVAMTLFPSWTVSIPKSASSPAGASASTVSGMTISPPSPESSSLANRAVHENVRPPETRSTDFHGGLPRTVGTVEQSPAAPQPR